MEGRRAGQLRRDLQPQQLLSVRGPQGPAGRRRRARDLSRHRGGQRRVAPRSAAHRLGRGGRPVLRRRRVRQGSARVRAAGLRRAAHPAVGRSRRVLQGRHAPGSDLDPAAERRPDRQARRRVLSVPARRTGGLRVRRQHRTEATTQRGGTEFRHQGLDAGRRMGRIAVRLPQRRHERDLSPVDRRVAGPDARFHAGARQGDAVRPDPSPRTCRTSC